MSGRHRPLIAIVVLAGILHAVGIARSILPAQDGLKFIRVARAFQIEPWTDVVRGTDQHPLYSALVATAEPLVALVAGHGPTSWRIAAQGVAALAALLALWPFHRLSRDLFGPIVADLATLGLVVLPLPMNVGHDTLSDSLALFSFVLSMRLGLIVLREPERWRPALGCGLAAGLGFLTRPEVVLAPIAVVLTALIRAKADWRFLSDRRGSIRLASLSIAFLTVVGSYALVKGEVSEKLALRQSAALGPHAHETTAPRWLPPGLDDRRWDFSPKEESESPARRSISEAMQNIVLDWADGLCGVFAFFAAWGLVRDRSIRMRIADGNERPDPANLGRSLIIVYLAIFTVILVRHEMTLGYLSSRHTLALIVVSLPWAAAGTFICARGLARVFRFSPTLCRLAALGVLAIVIAAGIRLQLKPAHPTRWGHREAGRWLAAHSGTDDAVLDTRGWAAFVSERPSYDYWHVRQALTDAHLAYVVVGEDELRARSRRAETLRALLAYAAEPVAGFPEKKGGKSIGVHVYRFQRPESWEGLRSWH